ncbi:DUF1007 family protein [Marinomonas mediterranea]|jgi:ABC-type uncharacterized transport system, periplasmic component|uniref:ABC transporter substrate-binding protein n=1 Tax=Marinomonas mediterranea (strain ATCC 700492 / JCM 21426 / NBRC 103028 / MMB-1) TaxID=717774 RepID=F2JWB3_MARM1|nr:DUF1007 family protein [Marinomonas mediterranea]ADZ89501.1 protein of unknown function DUF1007 [Marinomonas mediterranea MMB-1]WCN15748.1 DUF1007 family protein [Marinomonas mediterranea MMB-1]
MSVRHCIAGALALLGFTLAQAHPHIWVDSDYSLKIDSPSVDAVSAHWEFDLFTSASLIAEFDVDGDGTLDGQEKFNTAEALKNLEKSSYFIRVKVDGEDVTPASYTVTDVEVNNQLLQMELGVSLPNKVNLQSHTLSLAFGDESNYFAMVVPESGLLNLSGRLAETCTPTVRDAEAYQIEAWVDLRCDP